MKMAKITNTSDRRLVLAPGIVLNKGQSRDVTEDEAKTMNEDVMNKLVEAKMITLGESDEAEDAGEDKEPVKEPAAPKKEDGKKDDAKKAEPKPAAKMPE